MNPFNLFTQTNSRPALNPGQVILNPNYTITGQYDPSQYNPLNIGKAVQGPVAPTNNGVTRNFSDNTVANPTSPVPTQPTQQTPQQVISQPDYGRAESVYNPLLQSLDTQESTLEPDYQSALLELDASYQNQLEPLRQEEVKTKQTLTRQGETIGRQTSEAQRTLNRQANEFLQQAQVKFGGGSSTGGAVSELIGQQLSRSTGDVFSRATEAQRFLAEQELNLDDFLAGKRAGLARDLEAKKQSAKVERDRRRAAIQAKRFEVQSAKAQAVFDLEQQYQSDIRSLEVASYLQELNLDAWKQQQLSQARNVAQTLVPEFTFGAQELSNVLGGIQSQGNQLGQRFDLSTPEVQPVAYQPIGYLDPQEEDDNLFT